MRTLKIAGLRLVCHRISCIVAIHNFAVKSNLPNSEHRVAILRKNIQGRVDYFSHKNIYVTPQCAERTGRPSRFPNLNKIRPCPRLSCECAVASSCRLRQLLRSWRSPVIGQFDCANSPVAPRLPNSSGDSAPPRIKFKNSAPCIQTPPSAFLEVCLSPIPYFNSVLFRTTHLYILCLCFLSSTSS